MHREGTFEKKRDRNLDELHKVPTQDNLFNHGVFLNASKRLGNTSSGSLSSPNRRL